MRTYCCRIVAFRPPYSGALPGTSQPWSNCSRCQRRAQAGTSALDRERSAASASAGRCVSRNATYSARIASTSSSNESRTVLLGDHGPVLGGAAQHELAGLGPLERE